MEQWIWCLRLGQGNRPLAQVIRTEQINRQEEEETEESVFSSPGPGGPLLCMFYMCPCSKCVSASNESLTDLCRSKRHAAADPSISIRCVGAWKRGYGCFSLPSTPKLDYVPGGTYLAITTRGMLFGLVSWNISGILSLMTSQVS